MQISHPVGRKETYGSLAPALAEVGDRAEVCDNVDMQRTGSVGRRSHSLDTSSHFLP